MVRAGQQSNRGIKWRTFCASLNFKEIADNSKRMGEQNIASFFCFCFFLGWREGCDGLHCCLGFSLVAASWGYSLVAVLGLLTVVASLVECGIQGTWGSVIAAHGLTTYTPRLHSTGSIVVTHGLRCSEARRIFLDQGSNPCLLHWQAVLYHWVTWQDHSKLLRSEVFNYK